MPDLEPELHALGQEIAWPATPPRLWRGTQPAGRAGRRDAWRGRWVMAAAAVFLLVATLLAYTPTREAIADWINVHTVFHRAPVAPAMPSPRQAGQLGASLQLGDPTTLGAARHQIGWHFMVPASLGAPDAVYVKLPPTGPSQGMVTLVYAARPDIAASGLTGVGVLVTEARGRVEEQFFGKTIGPDVTIEQVSVGGHAGYWISGQPHAFVFVAADGTPYFDSLRLATNTLVFDDGGTVIRIEGDLSEQQAIDIGRSIA